MGYMVRFCIGREYDFIRRMPGSPGGGCTTGVRSGFVQPDPGQPAADGYGQDRLERLHPGASMRPGETAAGQLVHCVERSGEAHSPVQPPGNSLLPGGCAGGGV